MATSRSYFRTGTEKQFLYGSVMCGYFTASGEENKMVRKNGTLAKNGKVPPDRIRVLPGPSLNGHGKVPFLRSSHSLSAKLAKKLRGLAFAQRTSESSVIECALWLFFEKGHDTRILRLMEKAGIEPRRRRT
jgi:hypothetical protein